MQLTIKHSEAGREAAGEASTAEPAIQVRRLNIHYGSFHAVGTSAPAPEEPSAVSASSSAGTIPRSSTAWLS
jgi:hypothetical protein